MEGSSPTSFGRKATKLRIAFATEALAVRGQKMAEQVEAENAGGVVEPISSQSKQDMWAGTGRD